MQSHPTTQRLVQGLRPGHDYEITLKVLVTLFQPVCTAKYFTKTVPAKSQITFAKAISSTSIQFEWSSVTGADNYTLTVEEFLSDPLVSFVQVFTTLTGQIDNLSPSTTYSCKVYSSNSAGRSVDSAQKTILTSINPVTTIKVNYSCSAGLVTVTWDTVFGANSYRATAIDGTGATLNCTSTSTSCEIIMLKCGEKYDVRVTAISDDCESTSTASQRFDTEVKYTRSLAAKDCHPTPIHLKRFTLTIEVRDLSQSWETTNNTLYYVAQAVDKNGQVTECRTLQNTCYFTDAGCGQYYTYKVHAVSSECNSEVSEPQFIRTAPCLPTNIRTGSECHSETLLTTWDAAEGALSYQVEVEGNTLDQYNCTSSTNSCSVEGVPCGEHFSVWITASNDNCSTPRVLGAIAQAVPCSPTNVSAAVDCSPDSARINWTSSIGSIFYIVIAQDSDGNSYNCNSMSTNCLLEQLPCGQDYTASVIGTNINCNSSASEQITFRTAPCPPTNIEAYRDCDANHAVIIWQNNQLTGLYTATIEDETGAQLSCTSNTTNTCTISSLPCGKRFNVTVSYNDGYCSTSSAPISLDSVPCGAEDVVAAVSCDNGELTVTWNISVPTPNYTTTISGGTGPSIQCNSTETQCTLGGLPCGSTYSVIVSAVTGSCGSMPSSEVTVNTCEKCKIVTVKTLGRQIGY
ncbi:fibronectin type III domain-containing protein 7-like [Sphaeramia orbicularis]|uniref:fibronectin type III domain-containing protein 7-like n=1 Tax=Sphaeramia orbicularis TaxID=375764 RepID=UPI00117D4F6E|nr:fibronectin type III domain-containing protein 7-like [Sphaeramia orbicularis]